MEIKGEIKRTTIKLKCPNPLFEKWLKEWQNEAAAQNSRMQTTFQNALESLRKYPIVLNSGKECLILENFDTQLCVKLDRKLAEYRKTEGTSLKEVQSLDNQVHESPVRKRKKENKQKGGTEKSGRKYVPSYRSAAYALLVALIKKEMSPDYIGYMTKAELQIDAQCYTDSSFKRTLPGTYYNAWSTMSQLISKGLIQKTGNPAKYSLTSEGRDMSEKLVNSDDNDLDKHSTVTVVPTRKVSSPVKERGKKLIKTPEINKEDEHEIQDNMPNNFPPGSFTIHLLVDTAETSGDLTVKELEATGINFEVRHLKVGDFAWICRHKESKRELVLPYIVERKRLDDLSRSIRDGRFHEQKFRLKQCGLPNLIYLVEGMGKEYYGLPASSLLQAVMNTQVSDNFIVKITCGHKDSMKYLATLTTIFSNTFRTKKLTVLEKEFKSDFNIHSDTISLLDFKEFSQDIGKTRNFSIKEMFVKQLVQLHGMSADKAWTVVQQYPTPAALIKAYREKGPQLLSDLQYGPLCRRIGPSISIVLNEMYTKRKFAD